MAEEATRAPSTMSEEEANLSAFIKFLNYCLDFIDGIPKDVKDKLVPAFVSIFKGFETYKMSGLSDKWFSVPAKCAAEVQIASKANWLLGIGIAIETINLGYQCYRLIKFVETVNNASNVRDESRKKLNEAADELKQVEKLIKDFNDNYGEHLKNLTIPQFLEMIQKKDAIFNKLNVIKDKISHLEFVVDHQIKTLQMGRDTLYRDFVTGGVSGALSLISSLIAVDFANPFLAVIGITVGIGRVALSVYGGHKYVLSEKILKGLQLELDNIKKLGEHQKALQEGFTKLWNSISLVEGEKEGTFIILIKTVDNQSL